MKFAVFILTHGRPEEQFTYNMLRASGYTGQIYFVLDDTDSTINEHIRMFGADNVYVFDKNHYINTVEVGTNSPTYKCILYAKCACEDIAKSLGLDAFVLCDDDVTGIKSRMPDNSMTHLNTYDVNLDQLFAYVVDFLKDCNLSGTGFCEQTFFMPGAKIYDDAHIQKLCDARIPYQFIFRNTSIPVSWVSYYGEDDITELLNNYYNAWYKISYIQLLTKPTGGYASTVGGMADTYREKSEFERSFLYVMFRPDCVQLTSHFVRKDNRYMWIKRVTRNNAFPRIISGRYKK